jgi:glucosamine--fructose-6-phosphate aminotransferase (isomerizing)
VGNSSKNQLLVIPAKAGTTVFLYASENFMCGIIAAVTDTINVAPILLEGLKRLAYRGYDSAGMAVLDPKTHHIHRVRAEGKVDQLEKALWAEPLNGLVGIAHTRWATHGVPSERNAHPIISHDDIAIVHNGIIENHEEFRAELLKNNYVFTSETDTEVAVHLLHQYLTQHDFLTSVRLLAKNLDGAFALAILYRHEPNRIIAIRKGPPLVVGLGENANYIASDNLALLPVTDRFMYVEDGDIVDIQTQGREIKRKVYVSQLSKDSVDRGNYRHYMQKEIFEQAFAVENTIEGRVTKDHVLDAIFGTNASACFDKITHVQIAACGTSYHAGLVGKYWLESLAGLPCQVEIASELRYRRTVVQPGTLFVVLSQSGETADTLAALRQAKTLGYANTLAICNVPESSIVREADFTLLTRAGAEIGVASTKGFTTQLVALALLTAVLGRRHALDAKKEAQIVKALRHLPTQINQALALDVAIRELAAQFVDKEHVLFLGRGVQYPIAMEGALKLKELSYIHAEAYAAGELKHGPLALVDKNMPVIAVAPNNTLLEKLKSNLQEVRARGGELIVFGDGDANFKELSDNITLIHMPPVDEMLSPIVYTIPLQLLAYHVAVLKGTDVDQPRNLAKSVTVE